ncbi:MAG: hypothetical protein HRU20_29985 [Pseudomonadales bacterium]|nr:hypothetical protein [Pseudomonadales bacterium]
MFSIKQCPLPDHALLNAYKQNGAYTDCYTTEISCAVTHAQYVQAFYSTAIFRLERLILKWAVSKPSSDDQVALLATGETNTFAAWSVEGRSENQLLMCDFKSRTRSWLMIEPLESENGIKTRLYFGSAVVPIKKSKTGKPSLGLIFDALHGFHLLYSVALLSSAKSRLKKQIST